MSRRGRPPYPDILTPRESEVLDPEFDAPHQATHQPEPEPSHPHSAPTERGIRISDVLAYLVVFLILSLLIPATIMATFEVTNRLDFVAQVDQEIFKFKKELSDLEKNSAKAESNQKSRAAVLAEIGTLEKFREAARIIIMSGAIPLEKDLFSFRDLIILKAKSMQGNSLLTAILHGEASINKSKTADHSPIMASFRAACVMVEGFVDIFFGFVCNYSSNSLMALSLVFSSIIGSMVCYFRKEGGSPFLLRIIISGLVMGFIIYILIKGGKDIFIPGREADFAFSLNLYSASLLAVLAGTFADRGFRLFRSLLGAFSR